MAETVNQALSSKTEPVFLAALQKIQTALVKFKEKYLSEKLVPASPETNLAEIQKTKQEILDELENIASEEKSLREREKSARERIEKIKEGRRELDLKRFEARVEKNNLLSKLNVLKLQEEGLHATEMKFQDEIREGTVLIGNSILGYKSFVALDEEPRVNQEERHKKIERIKIKLEDAGTGSGEEVLKEYNQVSERDQFLAKELDDLTKSIDALESLAKELKEKLDGEFRTGVEKINIEFKKFFSLMFGGGEASLEVINEEKKKRGASSEEEMEEDFTDEEETETETGILINVNLPRKKVKELHALSGGERSLTSIALLFAMTQVNPPPFLILDETDAALDEANSKKYGDMMERLGEYSQLILVTHNRETMSRASILYGVTIGADGASKLLSIKFEEAVAIAK